MPISADQSAVLEMILTGGQSFEDLDDLFGLDEGESRERARAALEELGGADPDRNVGLAEYLLGQADPIGRADAVRHLRQDSADHELAEKVVAELHGLFPAAELPKLPQAPAGSRFGGRQSAPAAAQPAGEPLPVKEGGSGFSPKQTRIFAALAGAGVLLIVVVLAIAGVFSSDEADSPDSSASAEETGAEPSTPIAGGDTVEIPLAPPGDGDEGGVAILAFTDTGQPFVDLVLENLEPAPKDEAYLLWFMFNKDEGFPITEPIIPQKGKYENRLTIPSEAAGLLAQFTKSIELARSPVEEVLAAAEAGAASGRIERPGETVLVGEPPPTVNAPEDQQAPGEGGGG